VATFEQLSADQRAIVELILKRGQSYEELSEMLGMSEDRVRELAQTALVELAPSTAAAVDEDWRGGLADYILGQQSGPESTATRGHLRRSEASRAWARSLLDSLDDLYEGEERPSIPEGDRSSARAERKPRRERARHSDDQDEKEERPREPLSPDARAAVRRRRLIGGLAAALLLVALIVLVWPVGVLTKDDEEPARRASSNQPKLVGQTVLRPTDGNKQGGGVAVVAERGNQRQLIVQAQLPPSARRTAYEVWLYNSDGNAQSIGAQVTDKQGRYQGAGPLPADFDKFKYIDISREPIDRNAKHSGQSILRGATAPLKGGGAQPQQTQQPQPQPQQTP
jgi:Anti-sigma-K factor rskA/Sigma-70, region 4